MRKVLIGVAVAAIWVCAFPQLGEAQTATASVQPVRWEYLTVAEDVRLSGLVLTRIDDGSKTSWEDLGNQGWEFIAYDPERRMAGRLLIFKRIKH